MALTCTPEGSSFKCTTSTIRGPGRRSFQILMRSSAGSFGKLMKSLTTRPSRPEVRLFRKTAIDVLDTWGFFSKDPKEFVTDSSSFEPWSNLGVESLMRAVTAWIARRCRRRVAKLVLDSGLSRSGCSWCLFELRVVVRYGRHWFGKNAMRAHIIINDDLMEYELRP